MRYGRVIIAIVCTVALGFGILTLTRVSATQSGERTVSLRAYASTVCAGLAAPADAYRSMMRVETRRGEPQNVGLRAWYTAYFDTMEHTVGDTLSALRHEGAVDDAVSGTDNALTAFFGNARTATLASQRGIARLRPSDPAFDARIDQLTGGPIAPERFDAMLHRAEATPRLATAMRRAPTCGSTRSDMQLLARGRMLALFAGSGTPT